MFLSALLPDLVSDLFSVPHPTESTLWCHTAFSSNRHHFALCALWWLWYKSNAVCATLKLCSKALKYIPIFDIPVLMIHCDDPSTVVPALNKGFQMGWFYIHALQSKWRKLLSFLVLPFPARWFLPALLSTGETQASGVALKDELAPCLINEWHLCQSIHSAATACNKSHLAGRWADP